MYFVCFSVIYIIQYYILGYLLKCWLNTDLLQWLCTLGNNVVFSAGKIRLHCCWYHYIPDLDLKTLDCHCDTWLCWNFAANIGSTICLHSIRLNEVWRCFIVWNMSGIVNCIWQNWCRPSVRIMPWNNWCTCFQYSTLLDWLWTRTVSSAINKTDP